MNAQSFKNALRKFWADESGQTTTEYVLILALVVFLVSKLKTGVGQNLERGVENVGSKIDELTK